MKPLFDRMVDKGTELENGCIVWTGGKNNKGYGQVKVGRLMKSVHRVWWQELKGGIPEGLNVLHSCDNRTCFNIRHLFLGTQSDNMKDMAVKYRYVGPCGGYSQAIETEVVKLLKEKVKGVLITQRLGVTHSYVSRMKIKHSGEL